MNDMFAKLTKVSATHGGPSLTSSMRETTYSKNPLDNNPISTTYEIGQEVASAGPELVWKIHTARNKKDRKDGSIFFFDKRVADKLHKPKRKETISEILRMGSKQLDRNRHPRILSLTHSIEETSDTLAFSTEPVLGSLANVLGTLQDRLPQNISNNVRAYRFLDFEIKYGILQLAEALTYLHTSCKIIHRNVCPQSVIISRKGTWKLSGFEFIEKCNDNDISAPVQCQTFTSKIPKMAQPDLDFMAPEILSTSCCSPQSDMFSLGLLIFSIYNGGKSPLESNLNTQIYLRQLDILHRSTNEVLSKVDPNFLEPVQSLLDIDPRCRLTSQTFSMLKLLMDPGVHALQVLDVIHNKDSTSKMTFYHNLPQVMSEIPKKMWYQHMLPSMETDLLGSEVMGAALQPLFFMIEDAMDQEFNCILLPVIKSIISIPRSVQATVTLLENMDILVRRTSPDEVKGSLLPMLFTSLDTTMPQIQNAAFHALAHVIDFLDEGTIRSVVIPKTKQVFENNSTVQVQSNTLSCIERIMDNLNKNEILDHVLPMLLNARLGEPLVLMVVIRIYKRMLQDKRFGLTIHLLSTKVMPSLTPNIVAPNLRMEEEMLEYVSRNQRNKLKLERLSIGSIDNQGISHLQRSTDSPIGYPHRPPCLRLDSRRQSISVDDVVRRTLGSGSSSPDSNLLRVQAQLPGRRHSDNTIQLPRIQVNSSSPPSNAYSRRSSGPAGSSPVPRRHSQGNPGLQGYFQAGIQGFTSGYKQPADNIDFVIPSYQRSCPSAQGRRYSAAPVPSNYGVHMAGVGQPVVGMGGVMSNMMHHRNSTSPIPPSTATNNILSTLGTGMGSELEM